MRITVEIPDALARQAKLVAAERQTTFRALVVQGLEQVVLEKRVMTPEERAKKVFAAMDQALGVRAEMRLSRSESHAH